MDAGDTDRRTELTALQQDASLTHATMIDDHDMRNQDDDSDHRDAGSTGSSLQEGRRTAGSERQKRDRGRRKPKSEGTPTSEDGCMNGIDEGVGRRRLKRPSGSKENSGADEEGKGARVGGLGAGVSFV